MAAVNNRMLKRTVIFLILLFGSLQMSGQYDINKFFYRGRQFLIDGKYAAAIDNFNTLVQLDNSLYEAYFFRGIAKYNLGDFMGAEQDFDKTLQLNPLYTPAYHYRAITLSRTGEYDRALQDLAEAVDLRPSYYGLYFSRGVTYFLSQQFDKAINDFNRFLRYDSRVPEAYLNRGACYLYLKDTVKALSDYNKAVNLNMFDPEGYIRRSRIYAMQGNDSLAMEDLNSALRLDSTNSFAYFNRALIKYDRLDIMGALEDIDKVLEYDPGNALTLYNRALIRTQIGDYNNALDDYDRVLAVNPNNVLAYFNRAGVFLELHRYRDAMDDYSQAINLYPDFAKAYYNRAYAKNQLGQFNSARQDFEIAEKKVREYRAITRDSAGRSAFADTSRKYDSLLALDADFAKKDFNNELLQYRDIDIKLKPLYKFNVSEQGRVYMALSRSYESRELENFIDSLALPVDLVCSKGDMQHLQKQEAEIDARLERYERDIADKDDGVYAKLLFVKGILEGNGKRYNSALSYYDRAISQEPNRAFYYMNRGAVQAEIIDFISSMESNVQILTLDESGTARARVQEPSYKNYDYTAAIHDMNKALMMMPGFPYLHYNLGNLYCLSDDLPEAINQYSKAIEEYPYLAEAYYNRGLVLIYLKDKTKGCIDLSKAGELGVSDAYPVIKKYCTGTEQ